MIVEVLAIGTELLLGQIVNSNATRIGERLADAGLEHYQQTVVGDNDTRIVAALVAACSRADAVISYRITPRFSVLLEGRFDDYVSNDTRIQYDRGRYSLGFLWRQD